MKTGIFGGSFNPIHNGHIALAAEIRRRAGLDEVWMMVSPQNPLKQGDCLLDENARLRLARRALAGHEGLVASDYEFALPRPSYTWDTLCRLKADYPDRQFSLIIGGDNWALFDRWRHHDDILRHHRIIIYPRRGSDIDRGTLPDGVTLVDTPLLDISSTDIRERIGGGQSIDGMVPDGICDEVISLYRDMATARATAARQNAAMGCRQHQDKHL